MTLTSYNPTVNHRCTKCGVGTYEAEQRGIKLGHTLSYQKESDTLVMSCSKCGNEIGEFYPLDYTENEV